MQEELKKGQKVYWTDPDQDLCSGEYEIVEYLSDRVDSTIGDKVYYIKNEHGSEAEVFGNELSKLK